ncbi:MAG: GNAT family N-acetyltransferase [Lachnospiraceae bacterium]
MEKQKLLMKRLSEEEILFIYNGVAREHFPQEELKPVEIIKRLLAAGGYEGLGLFEEDKLVGYAFFVKIPQKDILLLDYYAVMAEYRNGGMGSLFLQRMKEAYRDEAAILLETEEPSLAQNEAEADLRRRRNAFYVRNGAVKTRVKSRLYVVELGVLYLPLRRTMTDEEVMEELDEIYRFMLREENYEKYAKVALLD